ncbi:class I SAM-dependent methyltransferase [Modicisalibacter luteus]|uniref:Class I SAM-dependent methyltransferase n=1 Tax=Modicisalibacter luteus TaxID=453962 RepID=A0ABV7M5H7_9GAMM|nr:methyltransferase domain-containing protein [Halomonas lutea]GHA87417.1 ubiquinone/menaquinone biosynthesis methyltransferase [Halomonas lutea]
MNKLNTRQLETVAKAYDTLLVPVLCEKWAYRLADVASIQKGQRILDVACGTGILARVIAERVGSEGLVWGMDANPSMLAVANRIAPDIEWHEGSAEALSYENDSFDAVHCQFGLMFFSSPKAALQEMMRVLKPGGHLAVAVFGPLDDIPAYAAIADVYERLVDKSVGDALRMPFSMGDTDMLASTFANAGVHSAKITTEKEAACFSSVRNMVLSDVKGWFPFAEIHLGEDKIEAVTEEAKTALQAFQTPDGAVEFQVPVHIVQAIKP